MATIVKVPPSFDFIRALQAENLELVQCLSELVDNAVGANATRISIDYRGHTLEVVDDGDGEDDLEVFFRLGASGKRKRSSRDPQRYGVGLMNVMASMGRDLIVKTVHGGTLRSGHTSISLMEKAQEFCFEVEDEVPSSDRGTRVLITGIDTKRFRQSQNDVIAREIGMAYYPALESGLRIDYRPKGTIVQIKPWAKPRCKKKVEQRLELSHDKFVDIAAGIIQPGEKEPPRGAFVVTYGPRVLEMSGYYSRNLFTAGFFCELKLEGRGWKLQKNKRGLLPEERAELEEAVFPVYEGLLRECTASAHDVLLGELGLEVAERLFGDVPAHKRQQGPVENPGLTRPEGNVVKGPQRFVTRENKKPDGSKEFKFASKRISKCSVGLWVGATEAEPVYKAETTNQYLKLYLNEAHPPVAKMVADRNRTALRTFIYQIAALELSVMNVQKETTLYITAGRVIDEFKAVLKKILCSGTSQRMDEEVAS